MSGGWRFGMQVRKCVVDGTLSRYRLDFFYRIRSSADDVALYNFEWDLGGSISPGGRLGMPAVDVGGRLPRGLRKESGWTFSAAHV